MAKAQTPTHRGDVVFILKGLRAPVELVRGKHRSGPVWKVVSGDLSHLMFSQQTCAALGGAAMTLDNVRAIDPAVAAQEAQQQRDAEVAEAKRKLAFEAESAPWLARAQALWKAGLPAGLHCSWEGEYLPGRVSYRVRYPDFRFGSVDVQMAFPLRSDPKDDIRVNGPSPCVDADSFLEIAWIYRDIEKIILHIRGAIAALPMPSVSGGADAG